LEAVVVVVVTTMNNTQNNRRPATTIPVAKPCKELEEAWSILLDETNKNSSSNNNNKNSTKDEDESLFAEKLASYLPALDQECVKKAWQNCIKEVKGTRCGEAFDNLFGAAEQGGNGQVSNHLTPTENYATSSIAFRCEGGCYRPCAQITKIATCPYAAVTLAEGLDPFAVLDVDGSTSMYAMATRATAHVVSLCIDKDHYRDVALPSCILSGSICSLYITTLDDHGVPRTKLVGYPDGSNGKDIQLHPSTTMEKKKMFIALAVFLNKFIVLFETHGREQYRRLLRKQLLPTNPVPTLYKQNKTRINNDIDRQSYKGEQRRYRPDWLVEEDAQVAATCGGMFSNVKYALDRILRFSFYGEVWDDQTQSPFYFRACSTSDIVGMTSKDVFLKVWDSTDRLFYKVDRERQHHKHAFDAGVPVAFPVLEEIVRSKPSDGIEYFVFVTEYLEEDAIGTPEELLQFSISLIETVLKLHNKARMLHCGLKPANVRWNKGVVKLIDFGSAQKMKGAICHPGPRFYTAPEVDREEPCSVKSEAYSVGATIRDTRHKLIGEHQVDEENEICKILEEAGDKLTRFEPGSRWSLKQALNHIQEKTRQLASKKRSAASSHSMQTRSCSRRK
jgi:hypothetical protein